MIVTVEKDNCLNFIYSINTLLIHIQPLQGWLMPFTFTTGCTCGYSYSTPSGLAYALYIYHRLHLWLFNSYSTPSGLLLLHLFHRFHLWLFIFNPFRVGLCPLHLPQVSPVAIHIQPLRGCFSDTLSTLHSTGCTCGYSYSTPSELACALYIYHRLHLWLFIFNPFGVGFSNRFSTGCTYLQRLKACTPCLNFSLTVFSKLP